MPRWLLAVDTATDQTAVALTADGAGIMVKEEGGREHSRCLLRLADELLRRAGVGPDELSALAVGLGPGSFTGVRVGLTCCKSLALAFHLPLVGVGTLESLAFSGVSAADRCPVIVAHRGLVYAARYRAGPGLEELDYPRAVEPEEWAGHLAAIPGRLELLGSGALRYRELFSGMLGERAQIAAEESGHRLKAEALGRLAWRRFERGDFLDALWAEPRYLRPPDAELARGG